MTRPVLKPGGKIGVMAPSSYVEKPDIEKSAAILEERGYEVFIHPQTYERDHQSAGTLLQKAMAFQGLWQRDDIDAILCAGGGNRSLQLLDAINFEKIKDKPKPLVGFSDVTALLNAVHYHTGFVAYHGPVFRQLHRRRAEEMDYALSVLAGKTKAFPLHHASVIQQGNAKGKLIGGNLSLFQCLMGSSACPDLEGAILFVEDCNEHLSRLDRMFLHLKHCGVFQKISGLILGEFLDLQEGERPFGYTLEELVREYTEEHDIPVVMNASFGHGENMHMIALGAIAELKAEDDKASLLYA